MRKHPLLSALLVSALLVGTTPIRQALAGEETREPPPTRSSDVLTEQVFREITRIQELMSPEDPNEAPDLVRAKELLDALYERRYERMNDFEKSTTLNFYTNYYLATDDMSNAIRIFEQMLTIENLRQDIRLRSLRALGQLNMAEERYQDCITYYTQWRDISETEDETVFLGLANSHFSLEQYGEAVPYLLDHMQMLADAGRPIERNKWGLLNLLYIEQESYGDALDVTKNMVVLFDEAPDWRNLSAIYSFVEQDGNRIGALLLRFLRNNMEDELEFLNLAQSLAGNEIPYSGAKVLKAGMDAGIVPRDEDNLNTLIQMYQLASEYDLAVEPARELAEISDSGDGYDTLGYVLYLMHDYEGSAEALQAAIDKGNLSDSSSTYLFLARALMELDRFSDAATAARRSSDLGDENDRRSAASLLRVIEGQGDRYRAIQERKANVMDFYESYPSLI